MHNGIIKFVSMNIFRNAMVAVHLAVLCGCGIPVAHWTSGEVPFVPTTPDVIDRMLTMAEVKSGDVIYDIGSGDGAIIVYAAKKYGIRGVGIEIDLFHLRVARDDMVKAGVGDRVTFLNEDLFQADIHEATVVTIFLLPKLNLQLIPKFRRELARGTRIVSHKFDMGDEWPPEQSQDVNGLMIYLWTIR